MKRNESELMERKKDELMKVGKESTVIRQWMLITLIGARFR